MQPRCQAFGIEGQTRDGQRLLVAVPQLHVAYQFGQRRGDGNTHHREGADPDDHQAPADAWQAWCVPDILVRRPGAGLVRAGMVGRGSGGSRGHGSGSGHGSGHGSRRTRHAQIPHVTSTWRRWAARSISMSGNARCARLTWRAGGAASASSAAAPEPFSSAIAARRLARAGSTCALVMTPRSAMGLPMSSSRRCAASAYMMIAPAAFERKVTSAITALRVTPVDLPCEIQARNKRTRYAAGTHSFAGA